LARRPLRLVSFFFHSGCLRMPASIRRCSTRSAASKPSRSPHAICSPASSSSLPPSTTRLATLPGRNGSPSGMVESQSPASHPVG
jgi:hypothetical protein